MPRQHRTSASAKILIEAILSAAKQHEPPISAAELARRVGVQPITLSRMKIEGRGDISVIAEMASIVGLQLTLAPADETLANLQTGRFFDA
jgi:hypothetical protein